MAPTLLGRYLNSMLRFGRRFRKKIKLWYFRSTLGNVSERVDLDPTVEFRAAEQVSLGDRTVIKKYSIVNGRSALRQYGINFVSDVYVKEYCYLDSYGGFIDIEGPCAIGQFCVFHGGGGLQIGKYVMFGAHCYVIASNHVFDDLEIPYMLQGDKRLGIVIEDNVWIGGGAIILDGVRIGRNSVVGAGAIVSRDVPANSIYVDRSPRLLKGALHRHSKLGDSR